MIENYILHEQIGQGEYGKVYRATDLSTQNIVAVKIVDTQKFNENPKLLELSMTEIKVLQQMSHCPYIIHFITLIKTTSKYYFIYEYCSGGPLDKLLCQQGRFTENRALRIFWQLLEAFKTLHQYRIMHRDLKPSNILIHESGAYKLADFGFCKPFEGRRSDVTSTMLGSPIYMAPEVLRGFSYDTRADIWSLGAVLYELIIGRCPFEEKSIAKLITAQDETDWSIPSGIQLKNQTITLLKSMLVKDTNKRCTWEYLFSTPLNREGEFTGEVPLFYKRDILLQPIDQNVYFPKQQYESFSLPLQEMKEYKNVDYRQELTSQALLDHLRENAKPQTQEQSFQNVCLQRANTAVIEPVCLQRANTAVIEPTNLLPVISEQPKQEQTIKINNENTLTEVIKERNKLVFLSVTLNDITNLNLLPTSPLIGYFFLALINYRYQNLVRVLKQYQTLTEIQGNQALTTLLKNIQKKNSIKRLSNNFEYVRLVDTIEKEATHVKKALQAYREQLDKKEILDLMDRKEQSLFKILQNSELNYDQLPYLNNTLLNYSTMIRSTHYMAFLDYSSDSDKNIVIHANQVLDSLQIDEYFKESVIKNDDVLEEFYEEIKNKQKKEIIDRFSDLQKKLVQQIQV